MYRSSNPIRDIKYSIECGFDPFDGAPIVGGSDPNAVNIGMAGEMLGIASRNDLTNWGIEQTATGSLLLKRK